MIRVHILVSCPLRLGQDLDGSGNPEKLCWEPQSARRSCQTSDDWVKSLFFFFLRFRVRTLHTRQMRQSMHVSQHSCLSELSRRIRAKLQISIKILFSKRMVRLCTNIRAPTCSFGPTCSLGHEDGQPCTGFTACETLEP